MSVHNMQRQRGSVAAWQHRSGENRAHYSFQFDILLSGTAIKIFHYLSSILKGVPLYKRMVNKNRFSIQFNK